MTKPREELISFLLPPISLLNMASSRRMAPIPARPFLMVSHDISLNFSIALTKMCTAPPRITNPIDVVIKPFEPPANLVNMPISSRIPPIPRRPFLMSSHGIELNLSIALTKVSSAKPSIAKPISIPSKLAPPVIFVNRINSARMAPIPTKPLMMVSGLMFSNFFTESTSIPSA